VGPVLPKRVPPPPGLPPRPVLLDFGSTRARFEEPFTRESYQARKRLQWGTVMRVITKGTTSQPLQMTLPRFPPMPPAAPAGDSDVDVDEEEKSD
jgi:hypothetical protein